ncbi:arad-like aldolase/epimerase [Rhizodiscina lignyota]|uniref:Arad-like aldolase/epimerase n=1 Tax=Rhizodiscina lignyota TaxID=1504668 RepID=A0A9P4M8I2_9PEZI|nr:arad-like aldolase/epimerase [Rhizodiscina lignyota]
MDANHEKTTLEQLTRKFITGCHILHYHNVVDAYGHLSFRHPFKSDRFCMSRYIAPGTISSPNDLIEYYVKDAEPVDPNSSKGYSERCIHSECYKRYPSVQSVIHSHSEAVVPYTISGVPLRPCFHMGGFLGTGVPVWDIGEAYQPDDIKDMLVRNVHLGSSLAATFSDGGDVPKHAVALMRGHGLTVVADNIEECVLRAIYTQKNAAIQTTALTTRAAYGKATQEIKYLSEEESAAATNMTKWSAQRPWKLWVREVEASNLYVNAA